MNAALQHPAVLWEVLRNRDDEQRDNSRKGQAEGSHPVSLIPSGDLGQTLVAEESEGRSALPRAARVLTSCPVPLTAPEGAAHLSEPAPTRPLPLPQCATACSSCGAVNLSSPEPNKLNLSPKGAWAVFCKQRLHKSCLSPSRLTLFSLPPHLLLAKWLNSFSI